MIRPSPVRPDAIRRHNLALLLQQVHRDGELTRAELTQRLGLSRSTIGALVADLAELGLVDESVPSGGAAGRAALARRRPAPDGPFAVAVDVDVDPVAVAAVGIGGRVLARQVIADGAGTGRPGGGGPADRRRRCRSCTRDRRTWRAAGRHRGQRAGHRAPADRRGRARPQPGLARRGLRGADAECRARAARRHRQRRRPRRARRAQPGSARGCDDVIYLLGRIGVGAGIIVDGRPLRGAGGQAGEVGHTSSIPPARCVTAARRAASRRSSARPRCCAWPTATAPVDDVLARRGRR